MSLATWQPKDERPLLYSRPIRISILIEDIDMGLSVLSIPFLLALAFTASPQSPSGMPTMSSVEPGSGRAGDILVIRGETLDNVATLYLTDGNNDIKVAMIEQTATSIKFKIPPGIKPGRLALMVLTKDKEAKLIEEPVKITIEPDTTN